MGITVTPLTNQVGNSKLSTTPGAMHGIPDVPEKVEADIGSIPDYLPCFLIFWRVLRIVFQGEWTLTEILYVYIYIDIYICVYIYI